MINKLDFVLPLAEVGAADAPLVGHKASALGTLLAAGFPVPPGICLTTTAFHLALAPAQTAISTLLHKPFTHSPDLSLAARQIHPLLEALTLPEVVRTCLHQTLREHGWENTLLAVRSSATAEDRPNASFAGQYLTRLAVRGLAALDTNTLYSGGPGLEQRLSRPTRRLHRPRIRRPRGGGYPASDRAD